MNNEIVFNVALTLTWLCVFSFAFGCAFKIADKRIPKAVDTVFAVSFCLLVPCWFFFIVADIWGL